MWPGRRSQRVHPYRELADLNVMIATAACYARSTTYSGTATEISIATKVLYHEIGQHHNYLLTASMCSHTSHTSHTRVFNIPNARRPRASRTGYHMPTSHSAAWHNMVTRQQHQGSGFPPHPPCVRRLGPGPGSRCMGYPEENP